MLGKNKRTIDHNVDIYGKLLDYKRGVGSLQWTILSLFMTAAGGILILSLSSTDFAIGVTVRVFGLIVYGLGYALYDRYYQLNHHVSEYLMELEERTGFGFEAHLKSHFHTEGVSSNMILRVGGCIYFVFAFLATIFLYIEPKYPCH